MMATEVRWLIPDHMIYLVATGEISSDDIQESITHIVDLIDNSDTVLTHILVNVRHVATSTLSVSERVEAIRPLVSHPKCGWIVMIRNVNPMNNLVALTAAQIFKARLRCFDTVPEGLEFLKNMASDLPDDFKVADYVAAV
jgi:hypothetical protein